MPPVRVLCPSQWCLGTEKANPGSPGRSPEEKPFTAWKAPVLMQPGTWGVGM